MKKLLLAIIVLLIIIASGIMTNNLYKTPSKRISEMLENASKSVTAGNWEGAKKQIDEIEESWDKTEKIWTLLINHFELDNIEMSLKKSEKYIESKDTALSLGELENLKFMVGHIYKKEVFNLKNIF